MTNRNTTERERERELLKMTYSECFNIFVVCWEAVLYRSSVYLHILGPEVLTVFVLDNLFRDVCIMNNLG